MLGNSQSGALNCMSLHSLRCASGSPSGLCGRSRPTLVSATAWLVRDGEFIRLSLLMRNRTFAARWPAARAGCRRLDHDHEAFSSSATNFCRLGDVAAVLSALPATLVTVATDLPPELGELADSQAGMLSRPQIIGAGLSGEIVSSRLRRGSWRQHYPGVYCTSSAEPSREARLWAAVLYSGQGAMLSHQTAAEVWGLADEPSSLVHITIPGNRRVTKKPGIVLHLSGRASEAIHPSGLPPRTRLEETVIDLCNAASDLDTVMSWLTRAIGRRLTTQEKLRVAVEARNRVRWRSQLVELLSPDLAGIHSVLEFRYVRDVERPHRFPAATRQAQSRHNGRNQYRDILYDAYKTAVELDGRVAHPGDTRWRDIQRDNVAATTGLT